MAASAPVPIAIIASTAATPIVMPTIVSDVCRRLRRRARTAMASVERVNMFIGTLSFLDRAERHGREFLRGCPPRRVGLIRNDAAVLEPDDPRPVFGDLGLVRDQDDGDPALLFHALENVH